MNRALAVLAVPVLLAGCTAAPAGPVRVDYVGAVSSPGAVAYAGPDGKPITEKLLDGGAWAQTVTAEPGTTVMVMIGGKDRGAAWCSIMVDGKTVAEDRSATKATCSYTVPK